LKTDAKWECEVDVEGAVEAVDMMDRSIEEKLSWAEWD
jgi:hypothetical protein